MRVIVRRSSYFARVRQPSYKKGLAMTPDVQTTLLQRRSASALVSRFILELAEPRPASGIEEGPVGVIPNGAKGLAPGSS